MNINSIISAIINYICITSAEPGRMIVTSVLPSPFPFSSLPVLRKQIKSTGKLGDYHSWSICGDMDNTQLPVLEMGWSLRWELMVNNNIVGLALTSKMNFILLLLFRFILLMTKSIWLVTTQRIEKYQMLKTVFR